MAYAVPPTSPEPRPGPAGPDFVTPPMQNLYFRAILGVGCRIRQIQVESVRLLWNAILDPLERRRSLDSRGFGALGPISRGSVWSHTLDALGRSADSPAQSSFFILLGSRRQSGQSGARLPDGRFHSGPPDWASNLALVSQPSRQPSPPDWLSPDWRQIGVRARLPDWTYRIAARLPSTTQS